MTANQIVVNAKNDYLALNQDEQFKKAYSNVEDLRVEDDEELKLKGYDPDVDLTNYVMNKLLKKAREEGGNMFMGDSKDLYEYIFEFYTDYEALKADSTNFADGWSRYISGVSNAVPKKKKEVSDTLDEADKLAAKEKKLEEEFKKKEEAIRKQAIADYKAEEKAKKEEQARLKEEAKAKAEAEKQKALEEAKRKEQEESETLGGMFDLL